MQPAVGRSSNPYSNQNTTKYQQPILPRRERPKELTLSPKSALELWHERLHEQHLHIPLLPSAPPWLQLQPGNIYELSGPGGSGKTQLALQCCINIAEQQPQATIHYLSLQGSRATVSTLGYRLGQLCATKDPAILHRIQLIAVHNQDDLLTVLGKHLPSSSSSSSIASLLVVDSIADIFRCTAAATTAAGHEETTNSLSYYADRARTLFAIAQYIRQRERTTVTLMLNQIALADTPALGLAWSQCVSSRWRVRQQQQQERYVDVYQDPRWARRTVQFVITTEGCRLVSKKKNH